MTFFLLLFINCSEETKDPSSKNSPDDADSTVVDTNEPASEDSADSGTATDSGTEAEERYAKRLSANMEWTLDFNSSAEDLGFIDCNYQSSYEGLQYIDKDYLCPDCEFQVSGIWTTTEGEDCASQLPDTLLGPSVLGLYDEGVLYHASIEQLPLTMLTSFTSVLEGEEATISWSAEGELSSGSVTMTADGSMRWLRDNNTILEDPWAPHDEAYACGWPQNNPGNLELNYLISPQGTFPNVRLQDQCGEEMDLWDFYGSYLIIDSSQEDCPPCRDMAEGSPAFLAQMESEGIPVHLVTLLGNGLSEPWGTPSDETVQRWVEDFALEGPVLADQGFAYSLFPEYFGYAGWPAVIIVGPDMNMIMGMTGFSGWDIIAQLIILNNNNNQ